MLADTEPQVAVGGPLACHRVVSYRHPRYFDDTCLDGVDQRKIRNYPGEKSAFGEAGTAQKERCGGKIINSLHADLGLYGLDAGNPDASLLVAFPGFDAIIASERFIFGV